MNWISKDKEPMPLEKDILVKHKYGVEAIHFFSASWKYWYSGTDVDKDVLKTITHWCYVKDEDIESNY